LIITDLLAELNSIDLLLTLKANLMPEDTLVELNCMALCSAVKVISRETDVNSILCGLSVKNLSRFDVATKSSEDDPASLPLPLMVADAAKLSVDDPVNRTSPLITDAAVKSRVDVPDKRPMPRITPLTTQSIRELPNDPA
jgi:hypothetical protein